MIGVKCPPRYVRDSRFSPLVQKRYDESLQDVCVYIMNPEENTLASASDNEYTVVITKDRRMLYIRNDLPDKPAAAGLWMDWPEEHWGISEEEYYKLPMKERAKLEAQEQLNRWVRLEYEELFVETWCADLADRFWWDEGGKDLSLKRNDEYYERVHELYNICKERVGDT